jgi:hypothetical protein
MPGVPQRWPNNELQVLIHGESVVLDTDFPTTTRSVYAAVGGNINLVWSDGSSAVEPIAAGERLPWAVNRINSASTTATGIRIFW